MHPGERLSRAGNDTHLTFTCYEWQWWLGPMVQHCIRIGGNLLGMPGVVPVSADCCAVRAPHGAVPLPAVAGRVDDHGPARLCGAATQPVHTPRGEMKRCADTDDSAQHARQCLSFVPIVQMPSFIVVVGEARIRGHRRHRVVQQRRPSSS
jgi:hypothetical protein